MKKLLVALIIFFPLLASAQMEHFFYGNKWSELPVFRDSLLKALPGYTLNSLTESRTKDAVWLNFSNQTGEKVSVKIYRKQKNDLPIIGRSEIKGHHEPLLTIYKYYFNHSAVLEKKDCFPDIHMTGFDKKVIVISFCPLSDKIWLLVNREPIG